MKKLLTVLAFALIGVVVNAQTTTTTTETGSSEVEKVDQPKGCAGKAEAKGGKACCAGKAAMPEGGMGSATGSSEASKAGCCAGKMAEAKGCHGSMKADAHDHAHGDMKDHVCAAACKDGAHAYACGEKGHSCSESCHTKL